MCLAVLTASVPRMTDTVIISHSAGSVTMEKFSFPEIAARGIKREDQARIPPLSDACSGLTTVIRIPDSSAKTDAVRLRNVNQKWTVL